MAAREKGGRVVFIGNIPYDISEEQICEIFGRVGQVVNFRLVYDKETGRPKGFGFLEYTDVDAAASAVRNLNDHQINGRTLRVDYSNDNGGGASNKPNGEDSNRAPPGFNVSAAGSGPDAGALPPLPPGTDLPAGLTAPDAISQTLQALPAPQLLDIISQLKNLAQTNPQQATTLLTHAPQLGYAVFQALLLLGLVDTSILATLVQQPPPPPQPAAPPPQQMPYQPAPSVQPPYQYMPPSQSYQHAPPPQSYAPTPPVQQPEYQAPPPAQPAPQSQEDLIKQVLSMTREQVYALDDNSRNQIIALRAQLGAPVM